MLKISNMKNYLKQNWPFFILLILAFLTRFLFLSYPAEVVFDEVHFGKFVSAYFSHQYYFDIHPPLGKLMIAGFAKIFGFSGNFDFAQIGEAFNSQSLFILRFLPALFGALFVVLIYKFVLAIGLSKKAAFLAGFLILFDNAFLVESKFILVDMFLLFFGFSALYLFILARQKDKIIYYILAAFFAGLALSIKWTGLSFLGLILVFLFFDAIKNRQLKPFLIKLAIFLLIPFLVYLSIFAIHFNLLQKSGPGDAFMTPNFRTENVFQKFVELNQKMYFYSSTLKTGHQDASKWYQWPLMKKPVWYWVKNADAKTANIYLFGNPLIWWLVAITIPIALFIVFFKKIRSSSQLLIGMNRPIIYLLLIGYFANLLPFVFINRVAFLYHYLPSLTFGILIFVLLTPLEISRPKAAAAVPINREGGSLTGLTEKLLSTFAKGYGGSSEALREGGKNNYLYFSFLFLVILIFLIFSPLSYGFLIPADINQFYSKFVDFLH